MKQGKKLNFFAMGMLALALPSRAAAHVKWFCSSADPSLPPLAMRSVFTPTFYVCLIGFSALLFLGTVADSWIDRNWPILSGEHRETGDFEEKLMRVAVGAFFLCLWDKGAVVPWSQSSEAILTPELVSGAPWITTVQFAIAVFLLWRRTCVLAGIGIVIIYAAGVSDYGMFHLLDYLFFLGIATYLSITTFDLPSVIRWRVPVVCASLSASLMWTAVEKFLYPQWTIAVLTAHPSITAGISPPSVTVIAGFVEFSLAFFISAGRGLLRIGAATLLLIFAAAVPEFGHLDVVGHFTIIAILGVVGLHGISSLQNWTRPARSSSTMVDALATLLAYICSLCVFLVAYYGIQAIQYKGFSSILP